MFKLEEARGRVRQQTVICVGDLMLDDFVYGEVSRISPEAPAPVIAVKREDKVIGGAGNVARNIVSLGARCVFVGVIGAAKGVPARRVIRGVIDPALKPGKPVIVDPKAVDFEVYRGAAVITPNRKELGETTRRPLATLADVGAAAAAPA